MAGLEEKEHSSSPERGSRKPSTLAGVMQATAQASLLPQHSSAITFECNPTGRSNPHSHPQAHASSQKLPHETLGCCSRWRDGVKEAGTYFLLPATPCCELCEIVRHALPDGHSTQISVFRENCSITCTDPYGERKQVQRWSLIIKGKVLEPRSQNHYPGQC
jgi:hypothetical protein